MERAPRHRRPPFAVFAALSVVIFFLTLSVFDSIGFVPYYIDGTPSTRATALPAGDGSTALTELSSVTEDMLMLDSDGRLLPPRGTGIIAEHTQLPARITIGAIDLDLAIQNPTTTDVKALDALLVNGPARYTDSARLGERGNIILFAHSSHLPIVHNKMYKAFNRIPELQVGDSITLTGADGTQYLYSVSQLKQASVDDDVSIPLSRTSTILTLVTCDTLSGKSARYVLTAEFVGVVGASQ